MADTHTGLASLLAESSIRLNCTAHDRDDAIRQAGRALAETGATGPDYISAMIDRENSVSTYVGEGFAFPHGTLAGNATVVSDALVVLRFPDGVAWDGNTVTVAIGIAAAGHRHIGILAQLATVLLETENAERLRTATTSAEVYELLSAATNTL